MRAHRRDLCRTYCNSRERRGLQLIFIESVCTDAELVRVQAGTLGVADGDIEISATLYTASAIAALPDKWGWGTFMPQRNPSYDPHDRSKGTVHICREGPRYGQLHA